MIDLHIHLLPGIDDGPGDDASAIELARAVVTAGTTEVAVTPHIDHQHGVDPQSLPERIAQLRNLLESAQIPLKVHQGGEVSASRFAELTPDERKLVTLGEGKTILLEAPFSPAHQFMSGAVFSVQSGGHRVLLGHPERSPTYLGAPDRVAELVDRGVMVQVTAGAMTGRFGKTVQDFAFTLFERGLVHVVSSDAHDTERRRPGMARAFATAAAVLPDIEDHIDYWTRDSPSAVLQGEPLSPPPAPARRRGALRRLRRRAA